METALLQIMTHMKNDYILLPVLVMLIHSKII